MIKVEKLTGTQSVVTGTYILDERYTCLSSVILMLFELLRITCLWHIAEWIYMPNFGHISFFFFFCSFYDQNDVIYTNTFDNHK